jgi:hypothetical protein
LNFGSSEANKAGKNLGVFDDKKKLVFLSLPYLVFHAYVSSSHWMAEKA